jgi:hypothetical protein
MFSFSFSPLVQMFTHICRTPEKFDMVTSTVDIATRKNLAQISKVLTQVASGSEFTDDQPNYVPINECVRTLISQMTNWLVRSKLFVVLLSVPGAHSSQRLRMSPMLKAITMPTSSWMRRYNRSLFIFHRTKCTVCMHYSRSTKRNWWVVKIG